MKQLVAILFILLLSPAFAQEEDDWEKKFVDSILSAPRVKYMGFQAGGGAGINESGAALGVGFNYLANKTEIGFFFLSRGRTKTRDANGATYTTKDKVTAICIMANQLFNYNQEEKKLFAIVGVGFGTMDLLWSSEKKVNGEIQDPDRDVFEDKIGTFGGMANIGVGKSISRSFDLRLEAPLLIPNETPVHLEDVLPHLLLSIGCRF